MGRMSRTRSQEGRVRLGHGQNKKMTLVMEGWVVGGRLQGATRTVLMEIEEIQGEQRGKRRNEKERRSRQSGAMRN